MILRSAILAEHRFIEAIANVAGICFLWQGVVPYCFVRPKYNAIHLQHLWSISLITSATIFIIQTNQPKNLQSEKPITQLNPNS